MRKIMLFLLSMVLVIILTGCGNKIKEKINQNIYDLISSRYIDYKKNIVCSALNDIVDIDDDFSYFITKDHKMYMLSYDQLYSNNENCKQVDTEYQLLRFYDDRILGTDEISLYKIDISGTSLKFNNSSGGAKSIIFGGTEKSAYYDVNDNKVKYQDNNIYLFIKEDTVVDKYDNIVFQPKEDETIDYIINMTIKTNKHIYVFDKKITNQEECNKYIDVDCIEEYSFYSNDSFIYGNNDNLIKNSINNILFYKYNGKNTFVIMNDGSVYTDANY